MPGVATAEQLAASITFLLSDYSTNLNGIVLPSDGGWSAERPNQRRPTPALPY